MSYQKCPICNGHGYLFEGRKYLRRVKCSACNGLKTLIQDPVNIFDHKIKELHDKIYGPKFCKKCDEVQPTTTGILAGSEEYKLVGNTFTLSFTGAYACNVCGHSIDEKT